MSLSDYLQQNYFELFQLPIAFEINLKHLKQKQQDFQKNIHPDNYVNAGKQEQVLAMQVSTQVNTAYQTLSSELQRAVYLLRLQGIDINAETDTQMPVDFLMQQMEVREALSEISEDEQGLSNIDALLSSLQKQRKVLIENLSGSFRQQEWSKARDYVRQFQFIEKLQNEIKQKTASIEDALIG